MQRAKWLVGVLLILALTTSVGSAVAQDETKTIILPVKGMT